MNEKTAVSVMFVLEVRHHSIILGVGGFLSSGELLCALRGTGRVFIFLLDCEYMAPSMLLLYLRHGIYQHTFANNNR